MWHSFVAHGVSPVFHVASQRRPFGDGWYTEPDDSFVSPLESVFLWTSAALAITDLVVNGVFDRVPDLRIGVVELSAVWVPMYLMMLDGGYDFTTRLNGRPIAPLRKRPSEYVHEHVRISSFAYELPARLIRQTGDLYMCCSDYPHSEGTATPVADYRKPGTHGIEPDAAPGLFHSNVEFLLRR
jgi:predicted TIM-barrel fold metal-dependent hydrolase